MIRIDNFQDKMTDRMNKSSWSEMMLGLIVYIVFFEFSSLVVVVCLFIDTFDLIYIVIKIGTNQITINIMGYINKQK